MPAGCFATRKCGGRILKAGDGERENMVKGGSWGQEYAIMRISVGERGSAVDKVRGGNVIDSAEGVKSVNCRVGHWFPSNVCLLEQTHRHLIEPNYHTFPPHPLRGQRMFWAVT